MSRPQRADALRNRERILAAASRVFAERGAAASTEDVAALAGVAIGTVFRHFPTKQDLLSAVMKDLLARLTAEVAELATADPSTALFEFFSRVVSAAAAQQAVVELLAQEGVEVGADPVRALWEGIGVLLARAKESGTIRPEVRLDETMALLTATAQGALRGGWSEDLRRRTLDLIFSGMRP